MNTNAGSAKRLSRFIAFCLGIAAWSSSSAAPPANEVFGHQILPIFEAKCIKCHRSIAAKGGLDLTTLLGVMKGGSEGSAVVPNASRESLIYKQISDQVMPPEGEIPVSYEELQTIVRWIDSSSFPGAQEIAEQATVSIHDRAKSLWSFQPLTQPQLPLVVNESRVNTPVDRFILAILESKGQELAPPADSRILIRRLYFDLLGLPPTPDEVEQFSATADKSYENLVERLLESPQYGERWGRHWLDVAGWSESSSSVSDPVRPGFWRYRDWVIRAFNDDKPYDQFVRDQLAGDELVDWRNTDEFDPSTIDKLVATGFLRCTPDSTDNQFISQEDKMFAAQQTAVEVCTKALLGLTLNCVRCHDHKYDPITQEEYYGLIALFQPAYDPGKWVAGAASKYGPGPVRAIPLAKRADREQFNRRLKALKEQNAAQVDLKNGGLRNPYRDRFLQVNLRSLPSTFNRDSIERTLALDASHRTTAQNDLLESAAKHFGLDLERLRSLYPEIQVKQEEMKRTGESLSKQGLQLGELLWALWDVSIDPTPTTLLTRGDFKTPAREIAPGILGALDSLDSPWQSPTPDPIRQTTNRRRALAEWLTRPDHPLTARVMANRVWQYHFGIGIVATPDDFGLRGAKPTHPELLDWLATEFVRSGWSVKHLHRLIVNSATYRQSSVAEVGDVVESGYAAFPRRRLEAEAVRDALLSICGKLDLEMFGPSVVAVKAEDGSYDIAATNSGRWRRSVYLTTRRSQIPTFLALFDAPTMDTNWPKRNDSAIAPQSLAQMNHPFILNCAAAFAQRLLSERITTQHRLEHAFALAYNRSPSLEEQVLFGEFIDGVTPETEPAAWRTIAHAVLAANEFLYTD